MKCRNTGNNIAKIAEAESDKMGLASACETSTCALWIASRVTIVFSIGLAGCVVNGLVIKIYRKAAKKPHQQTGSQLYMVTLAWIDLLGCLLLLPQFPLWELEIVPHFALSTHGILQTQSYLFVQVAMTFDRVFAVFRPLHYKQMRRRTNIILTVLFIVQQLTIHVGRIIKIYYVENFVASYIFVTSFALGLIIMLVSYPAIAINLYRQSRRVQQAPATDTAHSRIVSESQERTKYHVKTMRIYIAVLVLFLATLIPPTIITISMADVQYQWVGYLYYINNIGNPWIYYAFNDKFRAEVKVMLRSMRSC